MSFTPEQKKADCGKCRHLERPNYCRAWKHGLGQPIDAPVRWCKRYEKNEVRHHD